LAWRRPAFPFTAFVDQELFKLALILNAINPKIGGLLVRGEKGAGKSVLVRALADLLPEIEVVKNCPFNCSPNDPTNMCDTCRSRYEKGEDLETERRKMRVITLPIGTTEDRVVGTLDLEKVLREGVRALQPGILAEVNQNILYVDEINLLPDHIVDSILDAAAMGWNTVEREAISVSHPSRFLLVGTMNPEEGDLRPQLLDRLPISVTIKGVASETLRTEIVKRNLEFERDPVAFATKYENEQRQLMDRIVQARRLLPEVVVPELLLKVVAKMAVSLHVDGHRPDIVIVKAAMAIAAFEGRTTVEHHDMQRAAMLALSHRTRRGGFDEPASTQDIAAAYDKALQEAMREEEMVTHQMGRESHSPKQSTSRSKPSPDARSGSTMEGGEVPSPEKAIQRLDRLAKTMRDSAERLLSSMSRSVADAAKRSGKRRQTAYQQMLSRADVDSPSISRSKSTPLSLGQKILSKFRPPTQHLRLPIERFITRKRRSMIARRAPTIVTLRTGRYAFYEKPKKPCDDIALLPTIQSAAIRGGFGGEKVMVEVMPEDLRTKVHEYRAPSLVVLLLDSSGSMVGNLPQATEAILALHEDAYKHRDRVGLVTFKGNDAYVLRHPTTNLKLIEGDVARIAMSGHTPLAAGLMKAWEVVVQETRRNKDVMPMIVLITDGKANVSLRHRGRFLRSTRDAKHHAVQASQLLARHNIPVVVINPDHQVSSTFFPVPGGELAMEIARITKGVYYGFRSGQMVRIPYHSQASFSNRIDKAGLDQFQTDAAS
jgi:magnesium chelatase subunit D